MNAKQWAVLACVALSACAVTGTDFSSLSPQQISSLTKVSKTKFDSGATVVGPRWAGELPGSSFARPGMMVWTLRGWPGSGNDVQLYVELLYTDIHWRNYESASFVGGTLVPATRISANVDSCNATLGTCSYAETVGVAIPLSILRQHTASPLDMRLNAQSADNIEVVVPPNYISGFLAAYGAAK